MGGQAANASQALSYSRDYEREADRIGVTALEAAGYDPNAMATVLQVLAEKQSSMTRELAFLSTHPLGIERQSDLESRLDQLPVDTPRPPVLDTQDFALFRCVQVEGLNLSFAHAAAVDCQAIHAVMDAYRKADYQAAWQAWQAQPRAVRNTLTGLDLTIAFAIKAGALDAAREAIDTLDVLFPSWVTPTVARMDLALAEGTTELPRAFRELTVQRPKRLELWRALSRFAEATRQEHFLFEARAWDALLHGKLEASRTQLTRAQDQWPTSLDSRPLERLDDALSALERD
jgi:predicted Zn-dependent protease